LNLNRRDILKALAASSLLRAQTRYQAEWGSLDARPIPKWYTDAKFGIFIHWGLYSVPAYAAVGVKGENEYAEWYWNSLTEGMRGNGTGNGTATWEFHKKVYGPDFKYSDFAPLFRAEMFDPDHWADVFVQAGAKYVALTSKHHEGFTLWHSAEANRSWGRAWNSVDVGPRRDLLMDLSAAGRAKGLHMGIYYSLYEWYNPIWLTDKARYVSEHLFPQFKDVVTHAQPDIVFSDGEWELSSAEWRSAELLAWLFNESPVADKIVVDDRWGKDTRHKHGGYYTTEYTSGMQQADHPWEESRGMGQSYGYNRAERLSDYHTGRDLTMMLIDIVSRGGNLLLDIGPRADGRIPVIMEERLMRMGEWLRPNGECIYGTHALKNTRQWSKGKVPQMEDKEFRAAYEIKQMVDEPPVGYARVDAFFTANADNTYAIVPRWPEQRITLDGFSAPSGAKISLLETGDELKWRQAGNQLQIILPDALRFKLPGRQAYVLKMAGVRA